MASKLGGDQPPDGLTPFQEDVRQALALQQAFFTNAVTLRESGAAMAQVYQIGEGRQASARRS